MAPLVVDPCDYLKPHHSVGHCRTHKRVPLTAVQSSQPAWGSMSSAPVRRARRYVGGVPAVTRAARRSVAAPLASTRGCPLPSHLQAGHCAMSVIALNMSAPTTVEIPPMTSGGS